MEIALKNIISSITRWAKDNNVWFIKLNLDIPPQCLDESKTLYDQGYFSPHRTGWANGWLSCMLHNWDTYTNNQAPATPDAKYYYTEVADITPVTTNFLQNIFPSDTYGGCSFMCLEPGGHLNPHQDSEVTKFTGVNVAFNQPKDCYVRRADTKEEIPFTPNSAFLFNTNYTHEARNDSDEPRFHFLIHPASENKALIELYLDSIRHTHGANAIKEILQA